MTLALDPLSVRRSERDYAGVELGLEPPIAGSGRQQAPFDRRQVSLRWLCGTLLVGVSGAAMIGAAIYAALDRQAAVIQTAEYVVGNPDAPADPGAGPRKADRLIKSADIVAEKQSFRVPITLTVGDKQVIRMEGFTRVATTLTLTPTGLAGQVPEFNPLKLLASDDPGAADTAVDPGPALDESDAAFVTDDLAAADPAAFAGRLSSDEIQSQVSDYSKAGASASDGPLSLPAQLLLMRTTRATLNVAGTLPYAAAENIMTAPFSSIQVKMVPENVTVVQQTNRAHDGGESKEKLVTLHHGETLEDVLRGNGATREQIRLITTAFGARRGESPVSEGRRLRLLIATPDGHAAPQIARISVYADEALETTIALEDSGSYVQVARVDPNPKALRASRPKDEDADDDSSGGMELYQSLYETALKQNIPKPVIDDLVRIFGNDVDFQRSVAAGDTFDAFYADGEDDAHKDLLYASITVRDETFKYYRFQAPDDGIADFYDENGRSTRKFLIRKPVPIGEMTSGFGIRFHPILGYSRPHTGVDWGAPIGTPILAAGSGTVLTAERNSSYGNHIEVQHANGYVTTYSHMSGFARGVVSGTRVRQGQVIGYLGQTGLATGPHLHYEVIVNGHFVDPMRVKLARTREMDGKMLANFKKEHDRIDTLMASAPNAVRDDARASN